MFQPKTRVRYVPTSGPIRKAMVLAQVSDVSAPGSARGGVYAIRLADGRRITVAATQLQPRKDKR